MNENIRHVEADLTDGMLSIMMELFEVEILQGTRRRLANGLTRVTFQVTGTQRVIFEEFMRRLIAEPSTSVKVLGLPVSKN